MAQSAPDGAPEGAHAPAEDTPHTPQRDPYDFEAPQFYDFAGSTPPLPSSESSWFDRRAAHSPFHSSDDAQGLQGEGAVARPVDAPAAPPSPVVRAVSPPAVRTPHTPGRRSMLGLSVVSTTDLAEDAVCPNFPCADLGKADAHDVSSANHVLFGQAECGAFDENQPVPNVEGAGPATHRNGPHDEMPKESLVGAQSPQWPRAEDGTLASDSPQRDVCNSDALDDPFAESPAHASADRPSTPAAETIAAPGETTGALQTAESPSDGGSRGPGTKRRVVGGTPVSMRTGHRELGSAPVESTAADISALRIGAPAEAVHSAPPNVFASPRRTSPRGSYTLGLSLSHGGYAPYDGHVSHGGAPVQRAVPSHRVVPDEPQLGRVRPGDRMRLERLRTAAPLLPARSTKPLTVPSEFSFATSRRVSTRVERAPPVQTTNATSRPLASVSGHAVSSHTSDAFRRPLNLGGGNALLSHTSDAQRRPLSLGNEHALSSHTGDAQRMPLSLGNEHALSSHTSDAQRRPLNSGNQHALSSHTGDAQRMPLGTKDPEISCAQGSIARPAARNGTDFIRAPRETADRTPAPGRPLVPAAHGGRRLTVPVSPMLATRSRSRSSEAVGPQEPLRARVPMHAIRVATSKERSVPASPAVRKVAPTSVAPGEALSGAGNRLFSAARSFARPDAAQSGQGPAIRPSGRQEGGRERDPRVFPPPPRSTRPLTVPVSPMFAGSRRVRGAHDSAV